MQVFDQEIYDIVEKGLEGNGLSAENVLALYEVEETSKEAAYIRWAGQELSMIAADGVAEIHAQIGLNSTVCPKNCKFCSFAACNNVRKGKYELPKEDVLEYAKLYVEEGANLILMLTTASYSFDKLVDMVGSVREVIPADMPLLVNTDDMQLDQCRQLKAAGANGAYHAVRMCEGEDTEIPVEKRFETFANLREAGLTLSTCVEPVGPEHTPEELTEATMRCISTNPLSAGVGQAHRRARHARVRPRHAHRRGQREHGGRLPPGHGPRPASELLGEHGYDRCLRREPRLGRGGYEPARHRGAHRARRSRQQHRPAAQDVRRLRLAGPRRPLEGLDALSVRRP